MILLCFAEVVSSVSCLHLLCCISTFSFSYYCCLIVSLVIVLVFQCKSNQLWYSHDGITAIRVIGLNIMRICRCCLIYATSIGNLRCFC